MDRLFSGLVLSQAQPSAGNSTGQMISTLVTFALIFVIMYFLIIRPQNKKQKEMQKMVDALKKGDKVVTIGGIHGTVASVKENGSVIVKVDDDCKLEFSKSAIATVSASKDAVEASEPAKVEDKSEKPAEQKK